MKDPGTRVFEVLTFVNLARKFGELESPAAGVVTAYQCVAKCWTMVIAKVLAQAIGTLLACLRPRKVDGVATTIPLHSKVLDSAAFRSGNYDTRAIPGWSA